MITREQIAQLLKSISEAHYQIHSYGWGDVPDLLAREDVIYPFLMVTPSSSTYEEGYATHTYTISIADRVLKDKANEVNVDSDTHQILLDILSQIDNLMYDDVDVVKGGTITPFFDNFRHEVTGHFADVGIRVKFAYDSCAVPSDIVPLPLPPPFECADASYRVQYVNGTLIEEGTIVSGGSKTINVPNPSICDPANYEVRDADGNVLYSGTIASGGSENIVVTNSTVIVRKSDNTIISSVSVLAEGSTNYQVADSVVTLTDTDGATLSTTNVKATDPATIVAPNGTLNVNKSDGALISGQTVKSGETKGYNVADSVVTNDATTPTYTANVKATENLVLPSQQINVNSVNEGSINSVGTIGINITNGVNPVTPDAVSVSGRTVTIEVSGGVSMNVDFSADKLTAAPLEDVTFTDLSDESPTHWSWRFGDGTTSIVQNPIKHYLSTGLQNVTLLAGRVGAGGVAIKNAYIEITNTYFTDLFGVPDVGYSLRKLSPPATYSGAAIRVRRSSDNTEQDINFVSSAPNAGIDTAALLTFVGLNNGFITVWYDQSGNGRNVAQTSAANQPQIVFSGVVNMQDGKPAIRYPNVGTTASLVTASTYSVPVATSFASVFTPIDGAAAYRTLYTIGTTGGATPYCAFIYRAGGNLSDWLLNDSLFLANGFNAGRNPRLITQGQFYNNGINSQTFGTMGSAGNTLHINNSSIATRVNNAAAIPTQSGILRIGNNSGNSEQLSGNIQEFILWGSNKIADRAAVTSNQNNYYNVF